MCSSDLPADRLDTDLASRRQTLFMHEADETACPVAASFNFATIGIEDAVAKIDPGPCRRFDEQYLIAADAKVAVSQPAQLRRGQFERLAHTVQHDEIVAETMHLDERKQHWRSPGGCRCRQ